MDLASFIAKVNEQAAAKGLEQIESGDTIALVDGGEVVREVEAP
jgi:hypothetical protein